MSGLLNVTHTQMTQSIIDFQMDLLKNPSFLCSDKKGLPVDYYNHHTTQSQLDKALKIPYANIGPESPLRFNLIHNMYVYGIDRITLQLENGEMGIEGSEITGEVIILPNTIVPYPGDYFSINMTKKKYLFQIRHVTPDTLENGANYYKAEYKLEYLSDDRLVPLVVKEFNFVSGNIGTNYSPVLSNTGYNLAKILDDTAVLLKQYFHGLFYNNKVQTYTFVYLYEVCTNGMNSSYFYDPYLIEFIIKNKILANSGDRYDYIDHKTFPRSDFPIKYSKSLWRVIETKDKNSINSCIVSSPGIYIDDPATIFSTRYENYFEMTYENPDPVADRWSSRLSLIPMQVIGHINEAQLFTNDSPLAKYNLLIKYFNDMEINSHDMDPLQRINSYSNDKDTFYLIPIIIFILEYNIKKIMAMNKVPETS